MAENKTILIEDLYKYMSIRQMNLCKKHNLGDIKLIPNKESDEDILTYLGSDDGHIIINEGDIGDIYLTFNPKTEKFKMIATENDSDSWFWEGGVIHIKDLYKYMIGGQIKWLKDHKLENIELIKQKNGRFNFDYENGEISLDIQYNPDGNIVDMKVDECQWQSVQFFEKGDHHDAWYRVGDGDE